MRFRIDTLLILLLAPGSAAAHDLWVLPPDACAVGAPCTVRATQGMTFPEGEGPAPTTSALKTRVLAPGKKAPPVRVDEPEAMAARLSFTPKQAGLHVVAVETAPKSIELKAAAFNHYLVADGMPHVYRARHEAGTLDRDAVEQYQKFVKTLVAVGGRSGGRWKQPVGQTLEIVPLADPLAARPGQTLRFRVLFRGKPLPNVHVGWSSPGYGDRPVGTVRTDARGEAAVPITQVGLTSLRLTHMVHTPDKAPEWRSFWTTLTFRIPAAER